MNWTRTLRLGITMGDPGGIGPEVVLKALAAGVDDEVVVYGSPSVMELEQRSLIDAGVLETSVLDEIDIIDVAGDISWMTRPVGPTGADGAVVQGRALQRAMEAADAGEVDAIVTAPWNKALFAAIDAPVVGHTEKLAEFFEADDVVMMLAGKRLRVALVTTHIAIDEVSSQLTGDEIATTVDVTVEALRKRFGIAAPRVAVCGLNPHAGEQGHMGTEELEVIEPTVHRLARRWADEGVDVEGPFPSDTLFAQFRYDTPFDAVICMYHDQGLIPLKLLHFGESANITLGLPVVRTSVDHGTAYDIAGEGVADAGSMRFALEMAGTMAG